MFSFHLFNLYTAFIFVFGLYIGTIHLRRRQIFTIFDPYPLLRGFLILMYCDLRTIGTLGYPSPLRHADVLNEWSLTEFVTLSFYQAFISGVPLSNMLWCIMHN